MLVDTLYKTAVESAMNIDRLLDAAGGRIPFKNIPIPSDHDIPYGKKAGYANYTLAFYTYTTEQLAERSVNYKDDLSSLSKEVDRLTIKDSSIMRTGEISMPDLPTKPNTPNEQSSRKPTQN